MQKQQSLRKEPKKTKARTHLFWPNHSLQQLVTTTDFILVISED
jgi:hypothetical protein